MYGKIIVDVNPIRNLQFGIFGEPCVVGLLICCWLFQIENSKFRSVPMKQANSVFATAFKTFAKLEPNH